MYKHMKGFKIIHREKIAHKRKVNSYNFYKCKGFVNNK